MSELLFKLIFVVLGNYSALLWKVAEPGEMSSSMQDDGAWPWGWSSSSPLNLKSCHVLTCNDDFVDFKLQVSNCGIEVFFFCFEWEEWHNPLCIISFPKIFYDLSYSSLQLICSVKLHVLCLLSEGKKSSSCPLQPFHGCNCLLSPEESSR